MYIYKNPTHFSIKHYAVAAAAAPKASFSLSYILYSINTKHKYICTAYIKSINHNKSGTYTGTDIGRVLFSLPLLSAPPFRSVTGASINYDRRSTINYTETKSSSSTGTSITYGRCCCLLAKRERESLYSWKNTANFHLLSGATIVPRE